MSIRLFKLINNLPERYWPMWVKPLLNEYLEIRENCSKNLKGTNNGLL